MRVRCQRMRKACRGLAGGGLCMLACSSPPAEQNDPSRSPGSLTGGSGGTGMASGGVGGTPSGSGGTTGGSAGSTTSQAGASATGGTAGAGAPGAGGAAGSTSGSGGTGAAAPTHPGFRLLWRDDFDSFDADRWQVSTHTFDENLAAFTEQNVGVQDGVLRLSITHQPSGDKQYSAAEVRTRDTFLYGRFEGRIKFAAGSGVVSSLFTYKDRAFEDWDEIDIEYFGVLNKAVQFNIITTAMPGFDLKAVPHVSPIGVDPWADFHEYAFEWTPEEVRFFADGHLRATEKRTVDRLRAPTTLRMNCWPANPALFTYAGNFSAESLPAVAEYDWVAVYAYEP